MVINLIVEDVGVSLHTALRKCCDNKQTSVLYNAIDILPRDIWIDYCAMVKHVLDNTVDGCDPVGDIMGLSHRYSYTDRITPAKATKFYREASVKTRSILNIFECTLALCTKYDYENMLSFLLEETGSEVNTP